MSDHYYLAKPTSGRGPGVLVLHAWWGLNPFFRGLCDRLAQAGFIALAPDLYHGAIATTVPEAEKLRSKLKREAVMQAINQAAGELSSICGPENPRIGLTGFSLGGYWALWLADQPGSPVTATVIFYGTRSGSFADTQSAFQFHFAERDDYVSASGIKTVQKSLKAAGRTAEFYTYPGAGHWFFENDRPDAYNAPAAELAWQRSTTFFQKHLA